VLPPRAATHRRASLSVLEWSGRPAITGL